MSDIVAFEILSDVMAPEGAKCVRMELAGTPLVQTLACACCGGPMSPSCIITADDSSSAIRTGHCNACGYKGYMDHPSAEWLQHYYNTQWDKQQATKLEDLKPKTKRIIVDIVEQLGLTKNSKIFEVGTGYGDQLRQLADHGYKNTFGLEHSPHRADLAKQFSGAEVFHGVFGKESDMERIKQNGPYDFVFSRSVIEHMFDPNAMLSGATAIQNEGGLLMFSMPYFPNESSMSALFYIPHIHGFSKRACVELARRNGYVVDGFFFTKNIRVMCHKDTVAAATQKYDDVEDPKEFNDMVRQKWITELRLGELKGERPRIFWWTTAYTDFIIKTGTIPWFKNQALQRIFQPMLSFVFRNNYTGWLLRLFFGVTRKHVAMVFKKWNPPPDGLDDDVIRVHMKKLSLLYY